MIVQVLGRALGMFLIVVCVVVCVCAMEFYILHQSEKADSRFEIRMDKDIDRVAGELKDAGIDDKTVEILKHALQDVQQNTQGYVQGRSHDSYNRARFLVLLAMIFVVAAPYHPQRLSQKNPNT